MIRHIRHKFLHGKGIFMFLRSMVTSQISTYIDFICSFVLFAWVNLGPATSACLGSIAGGVVNCVTNYKFTFKIKECSYFAIGVKFFLIWLGSLLLNTYGTVLLNNLFSMSHLLDSWHFSADAIFATARVSTSLLVSVFWNFLLQRYFVFSSTRFDNFIDRIHYYCSALRDHNPR